MFGSRTRWVLFIVLGVIISLSQCKRWESDINDTQDDLVYLNHSDTVKYVGINTCKQCHGEIYKTYLSTGMGSSFHAARPEYSKGDFNHQVLIDSTLNFCYQPYWQKDTLWLKEFRIADGGDTVYKRHQRIDYIVGSGQHTNSHMYWQQGYLYQAPFTWYAQQAKLDMPPGFENGANSRFSRKIGLECTSCHNAMPTGFVKGSINKYAQVPSAIDCERCHGPGEAHVKRMRAGEIVDTAKAIDYSIVNVGKLSPALQFEVCQRCHLQGNPVLAEGKSFFDFKPGMELKAVMDVYLPRYSNAEDNFIMASHADRFKQSKCLVNNLEFNCTSCHNPHVSVSETRINKFNLVCGNCHGGSNQTECTAPKHERQIVQNNCVGCHMPLSGSTDIPHVSIHDHRIQIPSKKARESDIKKFMGLMAVNNPSPSNRSKTMAYLQQYERFTANSVYLDSAGFFIDRMTDSQEKFKLMVYRLYLAEEFEKLLQMVRERGINESLAMLKARSYDNYDAWTAYRIAEAARKIPDGYEVANRFLKRSLELMPYNPDVSSKYSSLLLQNGKKDEAESFLLNLLEEYPDQRDALNNLGFLYLTSARFSDAKRYFRKALKLDPDYELAWLNLASACLQLNESLEAKKALEQALRINPQNLRARSLYETIKA